MSAPIPGTVDSGLNGPQLCPSISSQGQNGWKPCAPGQNPSAPPEKFITIENDGGGNVGDFIKFYGYLQKSGIKVHIKGVCASSCTLVLAMGDQACLESDAALGFHAVFDIKTSKIDLPTSEKMAKAFYPQNIQEWFIKKLKGQKTVKDIFWLSAKELIETGTMGSCNP